MIVVERLTSAIFDFHHANGDISQKSKNGMLVNSTSTLKLISNRSATNFGIVCFLIFRGVFWSELNTMNVFRFF